MKDLFKPRLAPHIEKIQGPQSFETDAAVFNPLLRAALDIPARRVRFDALFPEFTERELDAVQAYTRKPNERNTEVYNRFIKVAAKKFKTPQQLLDRLARPGSLGM